MSLTTLLFGFQGRINRARYWLAILIYTLVSIAFVVAAIVMVGTNIDDLFKLAGAGLLIWAIGLVLFVAGTWSTIATSIKRLHDRDKSGWWVLLFWLGPSVAGGFQATTANAGLAMLFGFISVAISIWAFVEFGCLRGTEGPNQYGPDPITTYAAIPQR